MKQLQQKCGRPPFRSRAGITLIEVVIALAITGLVVGGIVKGYTFYALLLLVGMLSIRILAPKIVNYLNPGFNPWEVVPAAAANSPAEIRTEEEVLAEFLSSFKTGLTARAGGPPSVRISSPDKEPAKMFFAVATDSLGQLRTLLQKISATENEADRQTMFTALQRELYALKSAAELPQFLPVWQLATAMEGLVKQLTHVAGSATASTLRTFAGGLDVLQDLCVTGARADLFTHPPIRLLAVEDDPICRQAVSFSLKKALSQPDLAENGEAALVLARENAYDVIFLDVQMPGMNGYEVCRHIRATLLNANTPVVFVTVCSDFEGRAQSILSGGSGLIAKPFLTFEITVQALTFALRGASPASRSERWRHAAAPITVGSPQSVDSGAAAIGLATERPPTPLCDAGATSYPLTLPGEGGRRLSQPCST